jgi:hypothetical protein
VDPSANHPKSGHSDTATINIKTQKEKSGVETNQGKVEA